MGREVVSQRDLTAEASTTSRPINEWLGAQLPRQHDYSQGNRAGGAAPLAAGDDLQQEAMAYVESHGEQGQTAQASGKDDYTSRLMKYVPAEIVALFITLDTLARSSTKVPQLVHWGILIFGIVGTYLYLWRVAKVRKPLQLHISAIAFCVWVFAIGGPFSSLSWYDPIYGGLLLPAYTFIIAVIEA